MRRHGGDPDQDCAGAVAQHGDLSWSRPQLELVLQGVRHGNQAGSSKRTSPTQAAELFEAAGLSYHGT